jgi:Fe-S-cluster formation regulator IscX/YfhJ
MKTTTDTATTQQIEAAVTALDDERESLEAERAAFTQFRKRVAAMDVHTPPSHTTARIKNAIMGASEDTSSATQSRQVQSAYRETVMSVPHYEDDYDQSLDEDLAEEFSPELVSALATADTLTPTVQQTLLTGCQRAIEGRTTLLNALDREADDLQQVHDTLEAMNKALTEMNQRPLANWSTSELISAHERLSEFQTQCDDLAAERQAKLRSQRIPGPRHTDEKLNEYLYESLPVTYPVLADLAELSTLLNTARQRLERALITR